MRARICISLILTAVFAGGCTAPAVLPGGRTSAGYNAGFHHDRLRLHFQDWGSTALQTGPLDEAARTMWRRLPAATRRATLLAWSRPKWQDLPVHRLLVLRRPSRPPGPGYQWLHCPAGSYAYRRVDAREPALFEAVVPTGRQELVVALQIAADQVGGNRSVDAYLRENLPVIASSVRTGNGYVPFVAADPFALAADAFGDAQSQHGNYLLPLTVLRQAAARAEGAAELGACWQALATYHSFVGASDSARSYFFRFGTGSPGRAAEPTTLTGLPRRPAAGEVLRRAAAHRFVLFNEAHTETQHRAFVAALLPDLRRAGFTHLAVEALAEDSALEQRGFPTLASGFYTREPTMANLLRTALALGFRLVAYDAQSGNRERDQAQNLLVKTTARDPQARVVVLAGHGHISEADAAPLAMARWLQQLSGEDLLTINQTELSQRRLFIPPGAYVFQEESGAAWQPAQPSIKSDLYLYHQAEEGPQSAAKPPYPGARPVRLSVPADSLLPNLAHVVHVYAARELTQVPNPVPVSIQPVSPGALQPVMWLPHGRYRAQLRDQIGHVLWQADLRVD
ncbi:hypothetical protein D3Y59_12055 [Hymenobacter oligotrophus]|uniref:Erythromycin esterase family protein n=1 Tax=Hymenobacter oligotrophus TaxID=2319843 RepID=A0A3B7R147_9BACT|nr:hypothetical protein [Hymenobacter oligotrophus]AYA37715.1 hypothetical protein D3Y59_12055 [Hymenobacter oligotrophus]